MRVKPEEVRFATMYRDEKQEEDKQACESGYRLAAATLIATSNRTQQQETSDDRFR